MKLLRNAIFLGVVSLSGSAMAGDMYAPGAAYDWTGFYAGVLAGYGAGEGVTTVVGTPTNVPLNGGLAGVTAGANMQIDQMVFGLEGDISWAGLSGSTTCVLAPAFACNGDINWSGNIKARIGYAIDKALLYGTAGLAIAGGKATVSPVPVGLTGSYSDTYYGWTVGGGVEFALTDSLSAKGEYAYTDYGTVTAPAGTISSNPANIDITTHAFKVGLNYHF